MANEKTDDDGALIDPRYDPAFQRGFDGEVATGPRGQSTLRRTAAVNPAPARRPEAAAEQVDPVTIERAEREHPSTTAPDPAHAAVAPAEAERPAIATPRELIRNPFIIGLAALAALLILVGAIWAYEGFSTIVTNGGTRNEVEFWAAQTMSFGAPLSIVAGLAVVAVLLVLLGRSWQRSR